MALRGELQGNEVFVIVVLIVGTQTDEHSQLVVLQLRAVGHQVVGMDKHLQALILAQVQIGILIHSLRLALRQVLHGETERLLIILCKLGLTGVSDTGNARRQHIGHGLTVRILLHVDSTHLQQTRLGTC